MVGKPYIRGKRVTVGMIVGQIGPRRKLNNFSPTIPTWNAKMFSKPCVKPHEPLDDHLSSSKSSLP
jgi:hypothetical protein